MLLYGSLHSTPPGVAGVFNLDGYRDIFTQQSLLILLNTIGISLAKTIPSLVPRRVCWPGSWRAPTPRSAARSKCW